MRTLHILIACVLLATPALAQTTPLSVPTTPVSGQWRASKLIGVDVYNNANEKLGEINELIMSSTGQVAGAIIGVGGFLGVGERDIMVTLDKLTFTPGTSNDKRWYPEKAMMNATKDQLKTMPEFKY